MAGRGLKGDNVSLWNVSVSSILSTSFWDLGCLLAVVTRLSSGDVLEELPLRLSTAFPEPAHSSGENRSMGRTSVHGGHHACGGGGRGHLNNWSCLPNIDCRKVIRRAGDHLIWLEGRLRLSANLCGSIAFRWKCRRFCARDCSGVAKAARNLAPSFFSRIEWFVVFFFVKFWYYNWCVNGVILKLIGYFVHLTFILEIRREFTFNNVIWFCFYGL